MNPIPSQGRQIQSGVVKAGQGNVARTGAGGAKETSRQQEIGVAQAAAAESAFTSMGDGLLSSTKSDGTVVTKSQSGVEHSKAPDGSFSLKLPGLESEVSFDGEKFDIGKSGIESPAFGRLENGMEVLTFRDKGGAQVNVDTNSLTYEVLNKHQNVSQTFQPNGDQLLVTELTSPQPNAAVFNAQGQMTANNGFEDFQVKDGKITYKKGETTATRELARPIAGLEGSLSPGPRQAFSSGQNSAPTSLLAEDTPFLSETEPQTTASPEAARSEGPGVGAKEARQARLEALKKVTPDFFVPEANPEAVIRTTPSGLVARQDDESFSFKLPNGDAFRTNGEDVVELGDKNRTKNARLVEQDGQTILAYSDKAHNAYQLDVSSGDIHITNSDGSLKQRKLADGRQEFEARSTHTTATGDKEHSVHSAKFDADGNLVEKNGFQNLEVDDKSLVYTLPNGQTSVKNLVESTTVRFNQNKPADEIDDGWGESDPFAPNPSQANHGAAPGAGTAGTSQVPGADSSPFAKPTFAKSGLSRVTLPNGDVLTNLPSGISITDGEKPFAMDPDGNRLEVLKQPVQSEGGYVLYVKSKQGVGYTIAPEHLDMLVEGKEGKVHQLVLETGVIDTHIKDGLNLHGHQLDTNTMNQVPSPGVGWSPRTPDRIFIAGPDNRSYELPHPLPGMPGGQSPIGEEPIPSGVRPSMWERMKSVFTAENPWEATSGQSHQGAPPFMGQMPGSYHHYDPISQQMQQLERQGKMMTAMSFVGLGVSALSTFSMMAMPTMFYPMGGYW